MKCGHPVAVIRLRWSAVIRWLPEGRMSFVGRIAWSTTKSLTPSTHSTAQKWEHLLAGNNLAKWKLTFVVRTVEQRNISTPYSGAFTLCTMQHPKPTQSALYTSQCCWRHWHWLPGGFAAAAHHD